MAEEGKQTYAAKSLLANGGNGWENAVKGRFPLLWRPSGTGERFLGSGRGAAQLQRAWASVRTSSM
jgi:hypothetical protein